MSLSSGPNLGLLVNGALGDQHYSELMRFLRGVDLLVQPSVLSATLATPPATPADGDAYIVAASPTGAWTGYTNAIARWSAVLGAWEFLAPKNGWTVFNRADNYSYRYANNSWAAPNSTPFCFRNRVINGNFQVNQRGYVSGTALAAGIYAHDRWKAGASGCTYTFTQGSPDTLITITAGSLQQIIEGANIEGGSYILSWSGTAQASINGGVYTNSPVKISSIVAGNNITIEFNAGTIGNVQFEPGYVITPFERRPIQIELSLCQRYFQVAGYMYGFAVNATDIAVLYTTKTKMRINPTISLLNTAIAAESPPFIAAFTGSGSTVSLSHPGTDAFDLKINGFTGLTQNTPSSIIKDQVTFNSEI